MHQSNLKTIMEKEILAHINNPGQLEKMYRSNKSAFKKAFDLLYPEVKGNTLADGWNERLNYPGDEIKWGTRKEVVVVIIASLVAAFVAKLPQFFNLNDEFFYTRNIGFIVFPFLTGYFAWKNKLSAAKIAFIGGLTLSGLLFVNFLPDVKKSDTLILSCIHLLLFLWAILGFAFVGEKNNENKRLGFLSYNGDLVVMTTLILIAGAIMTGITIGLFSLIGLHIEQFYMEYIGVLGLAAAPIVGTYLTQTNPQLVGKVSPTIAKIFSPLVLMMLVIYLVAIVYSGKNPYNDREFLLIFNALLIGVMAIIFFSIAEAAKTELRKTEIWIITLLAMVTIIVNGIALSAILFRISEWGITPNRAAVLGSNVLILIHLLWVSKQLFGVLSKKEAIGSVGKVIAFYLPVYVVWTVIVTFLFPLVFGFS
jgi:hypothetical protein